MTGSAGASKTTTTPPNQEALPPRTEAEILEIVQRAKGRPLTDQERFLALEQARAIGEID